MNYIYDISLNFNEFPYDFYEWNNLDIIDNIKRIPIFKINNQAYIDLKENKIKINEFFLNQIKYKTEKYKNGKSKKIKYAALFSNGKEAVAIKFTKEGLNKEKSLLFIDEKEEIIHIIKKRKETKIKYNLLEKKEITFKTRYEMENEIILINELNKTYKDKNYEKINYIHLECFGKEEKNINKAFLKIKKEIIKGDDNFYKIFNIFKIINQNN